MNGARILIVEDDSNWIRTIRQALGGQPQRLANASTLAEATDLSDRHYFNVAIVDVSLQPGDPDDDQGMQFLKLLRDRGLDETVRTVVLSAYGSVRRTSQAFRDYKVINFLEKAPFDDQALRQAVQQALAANHLQRPFEVEVIDRDGLDGLWIRFDWAKREDPGELRPELLDLLRRLFPEATHLVVRDLPAGQSGAGVLQIDPYRNASAAAPVIVKFGKREKLRQEHDNYNQHVRDFVGNQSSTELSFARGRVMGAIGYRLIGASVQRLNSFGQFYARHSADEVCRVLDHLFRQACGLWYENREQPRRVRDLVELYEKGLRIKWEDDEGPHDRWDEVWQGARRAGLDPDAALWQFPGVPGTFPNPRRWLALRGWSMPMPAAQAVTHGDLNEHNVLVTEDGQCWLIDFYRTGLSHILRDVVEMETVIKFSLAGIADLNTFLRFEQRLANQARIDQPPQPPPDDPHAKSLAVIGYLRRLADSYTGSGSDMIEYKTALLLSTLNLLRLDFMAAQHRQALLSAALLCQNLCG